MTYQLMFPSTAGLHLHLWVLYFIQVDFSSRNMAKMTNRIFFFFHGRVTLSHFAVRFGWGSVISDVAPLDGRRA